MQHIILFIFWSVFFIRNLLLLWRIFLIFLWCFFLFVCFNRTVGRGALRRGPCRGTPPLWAVVDATTTRRAPPPSPAPAPQLLADPHVRYSSSSRLSKHSLCVNSHHTHLFLANLCGCKLLLDIIFRTIVYFRVLTIWIYYVIICLQVTWLQFFLQPFAQRWGQNTGQDEPPPWQAWHRFILYKLMCSFSTELIFLCFSSSSDRVHALPFSTQWPLHPPHPWLCCHHPRNPTQLLIILKNPWNPALPQPDFPGEESGRDPHPA